MMVFILRSHRNHGMYSSGNLVTLRDVSSDLTPTSLSADYGSSTGSISVGSTTNLTQFEGVSVSIYKPWIYQNW